MMLPVPRPQREITKLPKWAQDYIGSLERAVRERDNALSKQVKSEKSRVQVAYKPIYFPEHTSFAFHVGDHDEILVGLDYNKPWRLNIRRATGEQLIVIPDAANLIGIRVADQDFDRP